MCGDVGDVGDVGVQPRIPAPIILNNVFNFILNNVFNLTTISNILPCLYGITHLMTETTSYKRKYGKKRRNIGGERRQGILGLYI